MLVRFCEAYHSRMLTVPVKWLVKVLIYESKRQLIDDCVHYKCEVVEKEFVNFNKTSFDYAADLVSYEMY